MVQSKNILISSALLHETMAFHTEFQQFPVFFDTIQDAFVNDVFAIELGHLYGPVFLEWYQRICLPLQLTRSDVGKDRDIFAALPAEWRLTQEGAEATAIMPFPDLRQILDPAYYEELIAHVDAKLIPYIIDLLFCFIRGSGLWEIITTTQSKVAFEKAFQFFKTYAQMESHDPVLNIRLCTPSSYIFDHRVFFPEFHSKPFAIELYHAQDLPSPAELQADARYTFFPPMKFAPKVKVGKKTIPWENLAYKIPGQRILEEFAKNTALQLGKKTHPRIDPLMLPNSKRPAVVVVTPAVLLDMIRFYCIDSRRLSFVLKLLIRQRYVRLAFLGEFIPFPKIDPLITNNLVADLNPIEQKEILDDYCAAQTAALCLDYTMRAFYWMDPQIFLKTDKIPIPLRSLHQLGMKPAKGHLPMRMDPAILLTYYAKFKEAGLTGKKVVQSSNEFVAGLTGQKVLKSSNEFVANIQKIANSYMAKKTSRPKIPLSVSHPDLLMDTPFPSAITQDAKGTPDKIEGSPSPNLFDVDHHLTSFFKQIHGKALFRNRSPQKFNVSMDKEKTALIETTDVYATTFSDNTDPELDYVGDHDSDVCMIDGGSKVLRPLRCKLVPSANESLISKTIAKEVAAIAPLQEPWFVEMYDNPKIECRANGRVVLHLDEDHTLHLNVFVPELTLDDVDVILGDTAITRFGLRQQGTEIIAIDYDQAYRYY